MAYVLRPHKGNNNLDGWADSDQYGSDVIKSIEDPNGGSANIPITSIPSPFASMELVKNAYKYCADKSNEIDGRTIYHKLVSFSLDILEIFYNFEKYEKDIEIIPWYKSDLAVLQDPKTDPEIRRLGDTLALYITDDSKSFHFDKMNAIYMLNYKHGTDPINIIGGTSPTSLTIASSNNLDYVRIFLGNNHCALNSDKDTFCSLCHRDPDFVKYIWTMSMQPNFVDIYPEVTEYILKCFEKISDISLKNELRELSASAYAEYMSLTFDAQTTIYLAGNIALKVKQCADLSKSDFLINLSGDKYIENPPLVLPYNIYTEPGMRYVSGFWNSENKAPLIITDDKGNSVPMGQRTLPFDGSLYPFLTVDDVFQPCIIETPYPISSSSFFTANFKNSERGFLLPLKQTIFDYLSLEDIKGVTNEPSPRPLFEITSNNENIVKAIIRIPIQKGKYITFERNYFKGQEPCVEQNRGGIVECKFNLYLFPSYHIGQDGPQRIYVIEQDTGALTKNYKYMVSAFVESSNIQLPSQRIARADKTKNSYTSFYYSLNKEFDYLKISNGRYENILIPTYEGKDGGTKAFEFAVDFGTTNTHIEYMEKGSYPKPFEINHSNPFVLKLSAYSYTSQKEVENLFEKSAEFLLKSTPQEFIPEAISTSADFSFPMRTNLSKLRNSKTGQRELISLADFTIAFGYEKQQIYLHNEVLTDLKWNRNNNDAVKAYIEELLLLIRSEILISGGDLDKTTIKWFYPVSMSPYLYSRLETAWEVMCSNIISPSCSVIAISESVAPYYYYKEEQGVNSNTCTVVSVDVGGGTSDFVAYQNNSPQFVSSIRFAGNNIFGDFYGMSPSLNGFYKLYKDLFKRKIKDSSQSGDLSRILEDILANNNSADLVSFLFSLENNAALQREGEKISLSIELQENYQLKVVFLLFYTAIMYYIARLLYKKGIPSPRYITCSGTASKIFNIIGGTNNIQDFTNLIFKEVLHSETKLLLKQVSNPKEITCKGGLKMGNADITSTSSKAYFFGSSILDGKDCILAEELKGISSMVVNEVIDNYKEFIKFFFNLNKKMSFAQFFGIEDNGSFGKFAEILIEDAEQDFATVLEERLKDFQDSDSFEDSLFFYPLSGGIFRLAAYISTH